MEQPAMPSMKYSVAVEYQIDEKNMTVSQMWEYGKERGFDWYGAITLITEYRPETKTDVHVLGYSGNERYKTDRFRSVDEVKDGTQDVMLG
ncbi:aryl-sulfate sulfotransferase [Salmonella enterica subsp. enterica]|nr:aryl-sulfate sulfotransferase [Salmonella enterica subsp. enterica]